MKSHIRNGRSIVAMVLIIAGVMMAPSVGSASGVASLRLSGEHNGDHPGDGLAGGDVTGDGWNELIVGATCESSRAPCPGAAYVISVASIGSGGRS